MKLSGKKLTTAVLAGLMGATVAGISVVGAANLVVLDGTTLKVATIKGNKPIMNPVNVTKGIIDRTTAAGQGNIVSADKTVGQNLTALDTAVAANKNAIQKEISDRQAADDQLKGDMNTKVGIIQGQQDEQDAQIAKNKKDIQTNAGNIQNNTKAIEANSDKLDNHEERIASNEKNIETNAESIKKETNDRIDAVNGLQTNIDEVSGQVDALQKDSANVKDAATIINDNKDAIENIGNHEKRLKTVENTSNKNAADIGSEAQTRYAADQKLQKNIDAEADARDQADRNLQNQISNNSTSINDLYGRYSSLKTDINKVGARSAALAGLHPLDFDPANKLNFAVASGSFKGENSVALGAFYRPNENIMFSAASTMGDSDNAYTFGLSFKIGPSSAKTKTTSPDAEELYKVVGELQDQLAAQQKEIEQLKADKAK
ncbi:MAG: YadA-like family protein [Megasphaera elsdenii]|nr:YadA-like family protein [Megasphaera elsdenii]